jgi:hypothetical protein
VRYFLSIFSVEHGSGRKKKIEKRSEKSVGEGQIMSRRWQFVIYFLSIFSVENNAPWQTSDAGLRSGARASSPRRRKQTSCCSDFSMRRMHSAAIEHKKIAEKTPTNGVLPRADLPPGEALSPTGRRRRQCTGKVQRTNDARRSLQYTPP